MRWANILAAPTGPGTLPTTESPHSKRVHQWRVVDLESVQIGVHRNEKLVRGWDVGVRRFLKGLPYGTVFEPWEIGGFH